MEWKNVYIFISSTFNDMHAERDYLIKRAFPELRLWCNAQKLNLIDVDLRWGVSEKDATENKRVVDVCLHNLDKCRPFFIGLLGQRRGWVPQLTDITPQTLKQFPGLSAYIGKNSITELEIIHGLIHALDETGNNMRHAFFFHRKPDYLKDIPSEEIKKLYQGEDDPDQGRQREVERFKESLRQQYDIVDYDAVWNREKSSPELKNVQGKDLSAGRLDHFRVGNSSLASYVIDQLKKAIQEEFPEHFSAAPPKDALEAELLHQETFLFNACQSYIPRPKEEEKILAYFQGDSNRPYILNANAGAGKTSILAHLIQEKRIPGSVFYRFIGTSSNSSMMDTTVYMLMEEMSRQGFLPLEAVQKEKDNILLSFRSLLEKTENKPCCIILDAVDQWDHTTPSSLYWLPEILPSNVKLLISVKSDGNEALLNTLAAKGFQIHPLDSLKGREEKILLIQDFLSQFLKDIDESQIEHILALDGSDNPLYLKIVLNELRIHGSFDTLLEQFDKNYGKTPKEAFQTVLERLEQETFSDSIAGPVLTKYFLGIMANSLESVALDSYVSVFKVHVFYKFRMPGYQTLQKEDIMDAIYGLARHLSPYLVIDGNKANFLYDSFRQAVKERYADSYTELHGILATLYLEYCNPTGAMHYDTPVAAHLTSLIYHGLECSESFTAGLLSNPWFVYALLTKTSALKTASYFMQAWEKGYRTYDFKTIATFFKSIAPRLDIGPNTLFYELKAKAAGKCDIARMLCEAAGKEMELPYYYPACNAAGKGIAPCGEITLWKEDNLSQPEPFLQDDYVVYTDDQSSLVVMQSLLTGEITKKIKLKRPAMRSYAADGYLYVWYSGEDAENTGPMETFLLPSMESVFYKEERPSLPEGFSWRWISFGIDGRHYQYAVKEDVPPELLVYNLNTGEPVIHCVYPENLDKTMNSSSFEIGFCGEYFIAYSYAYEIRRIWHVPTGKLIHEEKEPLYCKLACEGNRLWCLTKTKDETPLCYVYEKTGSEIKQVKKAELCSQRAPAEEIGAYDGQLCLFFPSGIVWVYDEELQFRGSQKLALHVSRYDLHKATSYYHQYLHSYGDSLVTLCKSQFFFFDKGELEGSLQKDYLREPTGESAQIMVYGKNIAFLSDECRKLDLWSLRVTHTEQQPSFTYDTGNIYRIMGGRYVLGYHQDREHFYIQMTSLEDMTVALRCGKPWPEGTARMAAEFYHDGKVGVILEEKETPIRAIYSYSGRKEEVNCTRYAVYYYDIFQRFELIDAWKPDIYGKYSKPVVFLADEKPYFAILDANIDETHSEIQIYDAMEKKLVLSYPYDLKKYSVRGSDYVFAQSGKLYVPAGITDVFQRLLIEFDVRAGTVREHAWELGDIRGWNEKEVFLFQDLFCKVLVYSLETDALIGTIKTQTPGFCCEILRKGEDILVFYATGVMEVHSGENYTYQYRQAYPSGLTNIKDCPETGYVYLGNDTNEYCLYALGNTKCRNTGGESGKNQ